ncbi:SMC-Scp complex subunit ScpB [Agarilytica rhodophyticola]|uniref:SMC-Scp complex subunit ScpB n=1 Tax=Agarilytica rhodophyticola TaxID=1737490 RepID=UPI000B342C7A|nr:SMC-Scp complex subunit ScpB [Agarilytica rhodophyticola]
MSEQNQHLMSIIEGAIFAAGEPLTVHKLQSLFEKSEMPEKEQVLEALNELKTSYEGRGVGLIEVATGWRFQVRENVATWVNRLWDEKPQKYSRALIETLALIAYRQPITRGDIEEVRGVAVSSHIIKTLTERDWVKVIGHRDVPGRPALYATTKVFLDYFNLKSLDELPTLGELKDIESLNQNLEFGEGALPEVPSQEAGQAEDNNGGEQAVSESQQDDSTSIGEQSEQDQQEDQTPVDEDVDTAEGEESEEGIVEEEIAAQDIIAEQENDEREQNTKDEEELSNIDADDERDDADVEIEADTGDPEPDMESGDEDEEEDELEASAQANTLDTEPQAYEHETIVQTGGSSIFDNEEESDLDDEAVSQEKDAVNDRGNDRDPLDE